MYPHVEQLKGIQDFLMLRDMHLTARMLLNSRCMQPANLTARSHPQTQPNCYVFPKDNTPKALLLSCFFGTVSLVPSFSIPQDCASLSVPFMLINLGSRWTSCPSILISMLHPCSLSTQDHLCHSGQRERKRQQPTSLSYPSNMQPSGY